MLDMDGYAEIIVVLHTLLYFTLPIQNALRHTVMHVV